MRAITFIYENLPKHFRHIFYSVSELLIIMSFISYYLSIKDSYIIPELVMAIMIPVAIICIAWMFLLTFLETLIHNISLTSITFRSKALFYYILGHGGLSFPETYEWAKNCCEEKYFIGPNHILFQKKSDAAMFRMACVK